MGPGGAARGPAWLAAGAAALAAGIGSNVVAARAFERARTPIRPGARSTALQTGGLYRVSRNPMYLGMALALLGVATLLGSWPPFLVVPAFAWTIARRFIVFEERALARTFGEEYEAYRRRVRRWI